MRVLNLLKRSYSLSCKKFDGVERNIFSNFVRKLVGSKINLFDPKLFHYTIVAPNQKTNVRDVCNCYPSFLYESVSFHYILER